MIGSFIMRVPSTANMQVLRARCGGLGDSSVGQIEPRYASIASMSASVITSALQPGM